MKNRITKEFALLIYSRLKMRHIVVRTVEEAYWNYNMITPVDGLSFTYIDIYNGEVKTEFIKKEDKEDFIKDKIIILEVDTDIFKDYIVDKDDEDKDDYYIDYAICETLKKHKFYLKEFYDELKRLNIM